MSKTQFWFDAMIRNKVHMRTYILVKRIRQLDAHGARVKPQIVQ